MRKSTIVTLIVSVALIILSFIFVGLGITSSYDSFEYHFGRTLYLQSSYLNFSLESKLLTSFGHMFLVLGIAGIFLFAYLAIKNPRDRESTARDKERREAEKKARTVHYEQVRTEEAKKPEAAPVQPAEPAPEAEKAQESSAMEEAHETKPEEEGEK